MSAEQVTRSDPPELCLRFQCARCGRRLLLAVDRMGRAAPTCPGCSTTVRVPKLDQRIRGFDAILNGRRLDAAVTNSATPSTSPPPIPSNPPPSVAKTSSAVASTRVGFDPLGLFRGFRPRTRMRIVFWLLWVGPLVLVTLFLGGQGPAAAANSKAGSATAWWLFLGWWPLRRWIDEILASIIVPTFSCPGCGFEMDGMSRWSVGDYTPPKEWHILAARDPRDKKTRIGHTDCPQCGTTILM